MTPQEYAQRFGYTIATREQVDGALKQAETMPSPAGCVKRFDILDGHGHIDYPGLTFLRPDQKPVLVVFVVDKPSA